MAFLPVEPLPDGIVARKAAYRPDTSLLRPYAPHIQTYRTGQSSPRIFLEGCLDAMRALEPSVHAFVSTGVEAARLSADASSARWRTGRPLSAIDGMPFVVKDMIETRDFPTEMNSPLFRGWHSRRDAAAVMALRAAGGVILGKTVTTEFASGNSGPTRNPYDTTRTPGGSSSGSAAAVGAGMAPLGLGTQTIASTLRPSSFCGAYAFKPTHGALNTGGVTPLAPTMDHLGLIASSLEDLWHSAVVISAYAGGTPPHLGILSPAGNIIERKDTLSISLPAPLRPTTVARLDMAGWAETPESSQQAFEAAMGRLSEAGVRIIGDADPDIRELNTALRESHEVSLDILAWETRWPFQSYAEPDLSLVGERIQSLIRRAAAMDSTTYFRALTQRDVLRKRVVAMMPKADAFIALASSGPAIQDHAYTGSRHYPGPWTLVAGPSLSLPVLAADALPLGLQMMGYADQDAKLVGHARWVCDLIGPR